MILDEELRQFRKEQEVRKFRAKTTAVVFGVLAMIAFTAFVYAFAIQIGSNRDSVKFEVQMNKAKEGVKIAEQKAAKFETLAAEATARANEISDQCQHK